MNLTERRCPELDGTALPGYDYAAPNNFVGNCGYVTIPAGYNSTTLTLDIIDDRYIEESETVVLRVLESAPAPYAYSMVDRYALGVAEAVAAIADNETRVSVGVTAIDPLAYETESDSFGHSGVFRITRDSDDLSSALIVRYELNGSAENGLDYAPLSGVATLPAGASSVDVFVTPYNDRQLEGLETVVATLIVDESLATPYLIDEDEVQASLFLIDSDPLGANLVVPERGTVQLTAFEELEELGWSVTWNLDGDSRFGETGSGALRGSEVGANVVYNASAFTASANETENIKPIAARVSKDACVYNYATSIVVQNVVPQTTLTLPVATNVGTSIRISGAITDPGSDSFTRAILFGDETPGTTPNVVPVSYRSFATSHRYTAQGWYDVSVTVSDGKDASTTTSRIKVGSPAAIAVYRDGYDAPIVNGGAAIELKANRADASGALVWKI